MYRTDNEFARRIIVGAIGELDAELEESAYRWRQARMADLGFADYYEALEVYRELDPATVRIGDGPARARTVVDARAGRRLAARPHGAGRETRRHRRLGVLPRRPEAHRRR